MNYLRRVFASRKSFLIAAAAVCFVPQPLEAQITEPAGPGNNYYPRTDAPINGNEALAFIESLLHSQYNKVKTTGISPNLPQVLQVITVPSLYAPDSQAGPALPPLPGDDKTTDFPGMADHYKLATDAQINIALGAAVQQLLDGSSSYGGTLADLVGAVARYKKTAIKTVIVTATTNILNWPDFSSGRGGVTTQTQALEALTSAACEADPSQAAAVVTAMLPLVVPKVAGGLTGSLGTADTVKYGAAQITRTDGVTGTGNTTVGVTEDGLRSALNSIPGVLSKGGVKVTLDGNDLLLQFGSNPSQRLSEFASATPSQIQDSLTALGLNNYGAFTVGPELLATVPTGLKNDIVISFKPVILNVAGGTKRDTTPDYWDAADNIVRMAMEKAAVNGVAIVNAALGVTMQGIDVSGAYDSVIPANSHDPVANGTLPKAQALAKGVAAAAINAAYANNAGYLADEISVAIGTKIKGASYVYKPITGTVKQPILLSEDIIGAIIADAPAFWASASVKEISLVAAGLMKGFKGSIYEGGLGGTFKRTELPEKNIVEAIKGNVIGITGISGVDGTYLDNVQLGFQSAYAAGTNALAVAQAVLTGINGAPNQIAARLTGAAAWAPGILTVADKTALIFNKGSFIANVLQKNADSGTETIQDIIEVAVRSSATGAGGIANLATAWSKNEALNLRAGRYGQIAKGAALGLKGQPLYNTMLNGVVTKMLAAAPLTKVAAAPVTVSPTNLPLKAPVKLTVFNTEGIDEIKAIATNAISGALDAQQSTAPAGVVLTLAKATSAFHQFYRPILDGALDPASGLAQADQWRAVLAVMAAKNLTTSIEFDGSFDETITPVIHPKATFNTLPLGEAIVAYINKTGPFADTGSGQYATGQYIGTGSQTFNSALNGVAVTKGGTVIKNLQTHPKGLFKYAFLGLSDTDLSSDLQATSAVLTGVGLVSPASVPLAAALAVKARPTNATSIQAEAIGLNPALTANVKISVATASHIVAPGGSADLFDYLDTTIYQNVKLITDIVSAATAVAPGYAHIVAHVVGFRAPTSVAKLVPNIFNYAHVTSTDPLDHAPRNGEFGNVVDVTSAITAALTAGIVEAKTSLLTGVGTPTAATAKVETTNLKNAIVAVVKQVLTLTGNTPVNSQWLSAPYTSNPTNANLSLGNQFGGDGSVGGGEGKDWFMQYDPTTPAGMTAALTFNSGTSMWEGSFSHTTQKGPAGVITGFISQVLSDNDTRLPLGLTTIKLTTGNPWTNAASGDLGLVGQVITAAIAVVKTNLPQVLAIAQAAAQAAKGVSDSFSAVGEADIVNAILNTYIAKGSLGTLVPITDSTHPNYANNLNLANGKPNPFYQLDQKVTNAVRFGVLAAAQGVPAAGAAGVINFAHHTLTGNPVTDIFGL